MNLQYGHGYEQDEPGWYIYDKDTGLVIASTEYLPEPEQLKKIKAWPHLLDIYNMILRDSPHLRPIDTIATPKPSGENNANL